MASIRSVFLMTVIVTSQLNNADSQFSVLATGQVEMIKLLEKISTTNQLIEERTRQQQTTQENATTVLNEINNGQAQIIKLMEGMTTITTNQEILLQQLTATQTRMAESLEQIATMLQSRQFEDISMQPGQPMNTMPTPTVDMSTSRSPQLIQTTKPKPTSTVSHDPTPQDRIFPTINVPTDCSNISEADNQGSGVYTINPRDGQGSFEAYCDMDTDEGGWTVFQKRFNGSVDFYLGWYDYENGFGSLLGEHWLGLQQINRLTSSGRWILRIDLEDFCDEKGYAQYDFKIGDSECLYKLSISNFTGNISDSLTPHNGQRFTTKDRDNDPWGGGNCAATSQGAWWYTNCISTGSNLNGAYKGIERENMCWYHFQLLHRYLSLKKSEMKIRRMQ